MDVQIGATSRVLASEPFDRAVAAIARSGCRHFGYQGRHGEEPLITLPDARLRAMAEVVAGCGLTPVVLWVGAIALEHLGELRRRMEQAKLLSVPTVLGTAPSPYDGRLGRLKPEDELQAEHEEFIAALVAAGNLAETYDLAVAIKPHGGLTGTGGGLADALRRVRHARVAAWYDPGNVRFYEGVDPAGDFPDIASFVRGICAKDHRGEAFNASFPSPGKGEVDWPELARQAGEAGFSGPVLIELTSGDSPAEVERELVDTREFLERLFA